MRIKLLLFATFASLLVLAHRHPHKDKDCDEDDRVTVTVGLHASAQVTFALASSTLKTTPTHTPAGMGGGIGSGGGISGLTVITVDNGGQAKTTRAPTSTRSPFTASVQAPVSTTIANVPAPATPKASLLVTVVSPFMTLFQASAIPTAMTTSGTLVQVSATPFVWPLSSTTTALQASVTSLSLFTSTIPDGSELASFTVDVTPVYDSTALASTTSVQVSGTPIAWPTFIAADGATGNQTPILAAETLQATASFTVWSAFTAAPSLSMTSVVTQNLATQTISVSSSDMPIISSTAPGIVAAPTAGFVESPLEATSTSFIPAFFSTLITTDVPYTIHFSSSTSSSTPTPSADGCMNSDWLQAEMARIRLRKFLQREEARRRRRWLSLWPR